MSPVPTPVAHSVSLAYFCLPNNLRSGDEEGSGEGGEMSRDIFMLSFYYLFYHIVQAYLSGNNICK